ncbi:MAG: hypothetical protein EOO16_14105 [Chitinophagaceae bacterium]|nr:MAG: hypothetical protein EOO16_14105 [Chitinophagaceae bacterium]
MDFTKWAYHPSQLPATHHEKERKLVEIEDLFFDELKGRPDVRAWLEQHRHYANDNYESFLRQHVHHKRHLVSLAGYMLGELERPPELRFSKECAACLEAIQQKKLFDLQLQWRAEQIVLPGVSLSIDFKKMGREIMTCPLIDPVSPGDMELMKAFLATDDGAEWIKWGGHEDWQDYDDFFGEHGDEEDYPRWYRYCDEHRGTAHLLLLPNHRGKKEEYYEELGREVARKRKAEEEPPPPAAPVDTRPSLSYWGEQQEEFYRRFEDPYFQALFAQEKQRQLEEREADGDFDPDDDLYYLQRCTVQAPMPPSDNWRAALHWCMIRSVGMSVSQELDLAWSEYCFFRETGIVTLPEREKYDMEWLYEMVRNHILDGREACGETRDFDF